MENNNNYTKLYFNINGSLAHAKYSAVDDEFAAFAVSRLIRKVKEGVEKMIESEHIQNRTYALEVLLDKKTLTVYMNETFLDEDYSRDYDLPIRAVKYSQEGDIAKSAELFTKEYIDTFDADGELLKKAIDGVINYVKEALKKKTATDGVE